MRFIVCGINRKAFCKIDTCLVMGTAALLILLAAGIKGYLPGVDTLLTHGSVSRFLLSGTESAIRLTGIWKAVCLWGLVCILAFLSVRDIEERIIPNSCILAGIGMWGLEQIFCAGASCRKYIAAALLLGGGVCMLSAFLSYMRKRKVLGGGDSKLIFMAVLYLGFTKGLYMLWIAGLLGCMTIAVSAMRKRKPISGEIPFGPSLAAAFLVVYLSQ